MLIRRMTATFGKLQEQTLELQDGLNILQAPNETGKSTWCAFLLSMLYGVNTKERDRGGVLLLASSFAARFPSVGSGVYAATKAGVSSMVKTLAAEMAPYGIRVNGYIPGVINTEMNRARIAADEDALKSAIALQSFGEPIDVAWALALGAGGPAL